MFKRITVVVGAVSVMGMSGCASIAGATGGIGHAVGAKDDTTASAVGGGIVGCGLGAIAGVLHHGVLGAVAGCAVGGIAAGTISAVAAEKVQLDQQRANQQALQAQLNAFNANLQVALVTKKVPEKDATGKPTSKQTEAFDHLTVPLPAELVRTHSPKVAAVVAKVGVLASQSDTKNPVVIDVYAKRIDQDWLSSILDTAIPNGSPVRYRLHDAVKPLLVLSPVPVVTTAQH